MKLFKYIAHWWAVKRGHKLCSGYRIYPDGFLCPGCKDCKGVNEITPYHWED